MAQTSPESKWATALGGDFTHGNTVRSFVDGLPAFEAIFRAIQTTHERGDFIYLLAWWLDLDIPLLWTGGKPDPSTTLRELLPKKAQAGVQIRVMVWANWGKSYKPHDSPDDLGLLANAGINLDTYYSGLFNALARDPKSDPIATGVDSKNSHFEIIDWINSLPGAAGIVDWLTAYPTGSHHQKLLCARGGEDIVSLCGGVDINADRIMVVERGKGEPLHDAHCEVRGPAAANLVRSFVQRWTSHPWSRKWDRKRGALIGRAVLGVADVKATPGQIVRVAATFNQVNGEDLYSKRRRACKLERTHRNALLGAIASAQRFIYLEDQYLTSLTVAEALGAAGKNAKLKYVLALITAGSISDLPQVWRRRGEFIDLAISSGLKDKLFVYCLVDPLHPADQQQNIYVHAKVWIFDDELAYIGSANVNNRGLSSDSEVGVFVCEKSPSTSPGFAKDLRMRLWKKHLGFDVDDGYNGIDHWRSPVISQGANRVQVYNPKGGKDDKVKDKLNWNSVDPDAEGLPGCLLSRLLQFI